MGMIVLRQNPSWPKARGMARDKASTDSHASPVRECRHDGNRTHERLQNDLLLTLAGSPPSRLCRREGRENCLLVGDSNLDFQRAGTFRRNKGECLVGCEQVAESFACVRNPDCRGDALRLPAIRDARYNPYDQVPTGSLGANGHSVPSARTVAAGVEQGLDERMKEEMRHNRIQHISVGIHDDLDSRITREFSQPHETFRNRQLLA